MTELLRDQQTLLTILALMTPLITLDHHFFISFNDLTNRKTSSINKEDYIPLSSNFKHPAPDRIYVL